LSYGAWISSQGYQGRHTWHTRFTHQAGPPPVAGEEGGRGPEGGTVCVHALF